MSPSRLGALLASPALLASLTLLNGACSRIDASTRHALSAGTDDEGDPAVVAIVGAGDDASLRCTGTLIDRRVVLTAAHCGVEDAPRALRVAFGARLSEANAGVAILDAVAHPAYRGGAEHDLALLLLAEPTPVEPVPLSRELDETAPWPARIVGFGVTAAGADDDDRKREGWSEITEVSPLYVVLGASPSLPCNGDSGGPVLVETASGEQLAAVISGGDAECSAASQASRVDTSLTEFLEPQLEAWAAGSIPLAARCLYDEHCESGLCLEALDEPSLRFCSARCQEDADCSDDLMCAEGACRHPLPSPGAIGAACTGHDDCARGECLEDERICSVRCVSGRDECRSDLSCTHLGGVDFFCLPRATPASCVVGRGAAARGTPGAGLHGLSGLLGPLGLLLLRRLRRLPGLRRRRARGLAAGARAL